MVAMMKSRGKIMPKRFSDQERSYIVNNLKQAAAESVARQGIQHTTIDDLVRAAGIPKGTFYLMYPSKEQLILEVILEEQGRMGEYLNRKIDAVDLRGDVPAQVTDAMVDFFLTAYDKCAVRVLCTSEISLLHRKLPGEDVEKMLDNVSAIMRAAFSRLPLKNPEDLDWYINALQALFYGFYHNEDNPFLRMQSEEDFLRVAIGGIVIQMIAPQKEYP